MEQRILAYHRYMEEQIEKLEHGDSVVWERMLPVLPAIWHPALGEERVQELYPWRSLPALYLLDRNKNVLLKETSLQTITDFF